MTTQAMYPRARMRAGMYESFFLRVVSPQEPIGVWIRSTVHKAPGREAHGSVWCTVFDARRGRPYMHKLSHQPLWPPADSWIRVGDSAIGHGRAEGSCGAARWSLRFASDHPELRHLSPALLYRSPLPRTKPTSPAPHAIFDGTLELDGRETIELRGWPGMVGHNWGSQHAERWIWLHGVAFADEPRAWLDLALGRVSVAGRTTPWVASGAIVLARRRQRLGGVAARVKHVRESPRGCSLEVSGADGLTLRADVEVPGESAAGWRYCDPDGSEHDVINCSVAALELTVTPSTGKRPVTLRSAHGGAYELGMRERDHGVPIAPFADD